MRRLFSALIFIILLIIYLFGSTASAEDDSMLFDFNQSFDMSQVQPQEVSLDHNPEAHCLSITTQAGSYNWPNITLKMPADRRDISAYTNISTEVKNNGTLPLNIYCRIDDQYGVGYTASIRLASGEAETWCISPKCIENDFSGTYLPMLFGMDYKPAWAKSQKGNSLRPIDMKNVTELLFFVRRVELTENASFSLSSIGVGGSSPESTKALPDSPLPFVDIFGQYKHADWPGKIHSLDELLQNRMTEKQQLSQDTVSSDWDQYGGWNSGPTLPTTGYFGTAQFQGKWYLVDPAGHLFFSIGPSAVRYEEEYTPIDDRENWFENLPGANSTFADCYSTSEIAYTGYYANRKTTNYSFYKANLKLKYGNNWQKEFADIMCKRLSAWGMNTIGHWSSPEIYEAKKLPYVISIWHSGKVLASKSGSGNAIVDVFDPSFSTSLTEHLQKEVGKSAGDPLCIGYFIDGELNWGDEESMARACLASPGDQAAKKVFIQDLQDKYRTIEALNEQWDTTYSSWEDMLNSTSIPKITTSMNDDLHNFNQKFVETYFKTCRDTIKQIAPNQLYLGCCFGSANEDVLRLAQQYCDVLSFDVYNLLPTFNVWLTRVTEKPIIIGEYHFGAIDRGGFGEGLRGLKDQETRATAFTNYVNACLKNPYIVGCIWYKFSDQPLTGRVSNEENYQIGFVSITDTPYPELIQASQEIGNKLYQTRANGL